MFLYNTIKICLFVLINFSIISLQENEKLIYKTKFNSIKVGSTKISLIDNEERDTKILSIESSSNKLIDLFYKLRHLSTAIINKEDYSLFAITNKMQQGKYIDSYNATIDYDDSIIYYQNTKKKVSTGQTEPITKSIPFSEKPYDPFAIVFYLRTFNLEIGAEYPLTLYSKKNLRDITLLVIRKETIKTPYTSSSCYVIMPKSNDELELLKHQGEMKIWITDDKLKLPIKIQQKMKHGTMELILESYVQQ